MANRDLISITNHQNSRQVLSLPELSPLPFHSTADWLAHPKAINLRSVGKSQVYNLTPMTQIQAWPNTSCGRTAPRPPNSTSSPAVDVGNVYVLRHPKSDERSRTDYDNGRVICTSTSLRIYGYMVHRGPKVMHGHKASKWYRDDSRGVHSNWNRNGDSESVPNLPKYWT